MGLLSSRNLRKAKSLLDQNRHKVGDLVGKATEQVDKVSKGKTSGVSAKVGEAARKYSAGGATHHGVHPDAVGSAAVEPDRPATEAELQRRQAEANIAAANALKAAADAATSVFNKTGGGGATSAATPAPATEGDEPPRPRAK